MTSRVQEHRYAATATQPGNGTRPPGELWLNFPDYRLGMIDPTQTAVDLLAVRKYAATSTYALGDYVVNAGQLYQAKTALTPHAFAPAEWDILPTQAFNDARYTTQAQNDTRYYTKLQSDANYYSKLYIDGTYYTRTQSDARYYTQTQSDGRFLSINGGTLFGELTVGGLGIHYTRTGGYNHAMAFGWDGGTPMIWVDNTFVGYLATQAYVQSTEANYLLLTGGTITGGLQVNGNETVLGTLQNSNGRLITYAPNYAPTLTLWQGSLNAAMGFWFDGNFNFGGMDGGGNAVSYLGRLMSNGSIEATNRIIGDQGMFANGGQDFGVFQSGQWRIMQYASSWGLWWDTTTGALYYQTPSGFRWSLDGGGNGHFLGSLQVDGNLTFGGSLNCWDLHAGGTISCDHDINANGDLHANNVRSNNAVSANGGDIWMGAGGSGRVLQMASGWYWDWVGSNGDLYWNRPGGGFFAIRNSDGIVMDFGGPCAGVGNYINFSDVRAKRDIAPAEQGLTEILKLNPVTFRRLDHDRTEIGFIAQEIEQVLPEAIRPLGVVLPDGTGGLDSEAPTLGFGLDPIVAALVNATKALNARIAALEAR